jgi:glucose-6-phosphate isomerase
MHWLLRYPALAPEDIAQDAIKNVANELAAVHATLDAMLAFAQTVRDDTAITDVVNIGIGGSDLGPQMAVRALDAFATLANGFTLSPTWMGMSWTPRCVRLKPESTLFLIASKTFTTIETMTNARRPKPGLPRKVAPTRRATLLR